MLARHRRQPDSAGAVIRHDEHVTALEHAVLAAFTTETTCSRKRNRPPSDASLAALAAVRGLPAVSPAPASMDEYARLAEAC